MSSPDLAPGKGNAILGSSASWDVDACWREVTGGGNTATERRVEPETKLSSTTRGIQAEIEETAQIPSTSGVESAAKPTTGSPSWDIDDIYFDLFPPKSSRR